MKWPGSAAWAGTHRHDERSGTRPSDADLIVVVILMGFPTAFTLMGLGMFFGFLAFYAQATAGPRTGCST
jgi:hypothetical protein